MAWNNKFEELTHNKSNTFILIKTNFSTIVLIIRTLKKIVFKLN